jgi:protein-S-isoprenylcysteine O-methyltransferase Ste14
MVLAIVASVFFLSAGSLNFKEAWIFLLAFALSSSMLGIYLFKKDKRHITNRLNVGNAAEKEKGQKIIQLFLNLFSVGLLVVPGLDHRFHWSTVPVSFAIIADILLVAAFLIVLLVFRENNYASNIIETTSDQKVISSGFNGSTMATFLSTVMCAMSVWLYHSVGTTLMIVPDLP